MSPRARAPLVAFAASLGLIGTYLAFGGAAYEPTTVADPCLTRDATVLEARGTFEAVALSALDGAACELQVSREELTIALADEQATAEFAAARGIDDAAIEEAVRAGLVRAVDDQAATGEIDGLEETLLREVAERAPVGAAIEALRALPGDDSVQDLLGRLSELGAIELPNIAELPNVNDLPDIEELEGLLP